MLLPIAVVLALVLVSQGVIQNFSAYRDVTMLQPVTYQQQKTDAAGNPLKDAAGNPVMENVTTQTQTLPMGPIASQEIIKELGTNGGGFFNANSAHPYENPTPLSNFLEMLAIIVIPAALTYTFGHMVGDTRQGWAVLAAMAILFVSLYAICNHYEQLGNPRIAALGVDQAPSCPAAGRQHGGQGGALRHRRLHALRHDHHQHLDCGAVNSMHDSYTPLGGFVPLFAMMLGEVVFGGVGTGLYSMLIFAIIGVFIAGLMIGRTPEYLGKKIESFEMKMSSIAILVMPFIVLVGTAAGREHHGRPGGRRQSGRARLLGNPLRLHLGRATTTAAPSPASRPIRSSTTPRSGWRCGSAGTGPSSRCSRSRARLAAKKRIPVTAGTMPTHGPTFIILLIGTVLLVGALTFVPALALGPVVEHLTLWGR